jgi:hypothetical protein
MKGLKSLKGFKGLRGFKSFIAQGSVLVLILMGRFIHRSG